MEAPGYGRYYIRYDVTQKSLNVNQPMGEYMKSQWKKDADDLETPGVIVVRVDTEEDLVQWYFNGKKQIEYKVKQKIKDMKDIKVWAALPTSDSVI